LLNVLRACKFSEYLKNALKVIATSKGGKNRVKTF
jgi:hypothetical protein